MSTEPTEPEDFVSLYRRAFEQFGASALWSSKPVPDPTPGWRSRTVRGLRAIAKAGGWRRHLPFHAVQDEPGSGSVTIFNGDMLDGLDLHTGAFPPRFADRTAGVLDAHTREGTRLGPAFRVTASASNLGFLGEGGVADIATNHRSSASVVLIHPRLPKHSGRLEITEASFNDAVRSRRHRCMPPHQS